MQARLLGAFTALVASVAGYVTYLYVSSSVRDESFSEYLGILHIEPAGPRLPLCLASMPDDVLGAIQAVQPSGLDVVPTCRASASFPGVRVENALELQANTLTDDSRVVSATEARRAFVMYTQSYDPDSSSNSKTQGVTSLQALLAERYSFVCSSRGAAFVLRAVLGGLGLDGEGAAVSIVSESDMDLESETVPGRIHCALIPVRLRHAPRSKGQNQGQNQNQSPADPQFTTRKLIIVDYVTPEVRTMLALKAPYARITGVFTTDVLPASLGGRIVDLLGAEDMIVVHPSRAQDPLVALLASALLRGDTSTPSSTPNLNATTEYYSQYFALTPGSMRVVRERRVDRTVEVTEGFTEEKTVQTSNTKQLFKQDRDVSGAFTVAYGGRVRQLRLVNGELDGVPLRVGDRVTLGNQARAAENGDYIVAHRVALAEVERAGYAVELQSPPVADVRETLHMRKRASGCVEVFTDSTMQAVHDLRLSFGDAVYVPQLASFAVVLNPRELRILARYEKDEKYHAKAVCSNDAAVLVKELCESHVDALGNPKAAGVWDRPCEMDAECPFFGRHGGRGGCMNSGYCELPLGVQRVGFRSFTGTPLCQGCGPSRADCCVEQHPPEYAFP
jgi:hypothetical protein